MDLKFWTVEFWKNIGYGLGSSSYLVQRLVQIADILNVSLIVELGAGQGQVTDYILQKKSEHTRFVVIENDHDSYKILEKKYGHLCEVYEMSAAHIDTIVGKECVDIIISTLPLGSISDPGVLHILSAAQSVLKKGGRFIQYQYWMANKKDVKKYFHIDRIYWEPRNIGPAFIYQAHKK